MAWPRNLSRTLALTLPLLLFGAAPSAAAQPGGAFELLHRVESVYRDLAGYSDTGQIEVRSPDAPPLRLRFTTRAAGGEVCFEVDRGPFEPWKVLWTEGGEAFHYDAARGQVKVQASLAAELAHGVVVGGQEALLVPLLLAGGAIEDPVGAALDPPVPCEGGRCRVLALSWMGGAVAARLWVAEDSDLIRQVEVELYPLEAAVPGGERSVPTVVRVVHRPRATPGDIETAFLPPSSASRVELWEGEPAGREPGQVPEATFGETISVELVSVRLRVLDRTGEPVRGLGAEDFRAVVRRGGGKREVPVVAADWISSAPPRPETLERLPGDVPWGEDLEPGWTPPPRGKLVLFFVQADFNAIRVLGHMKLQPLVGDLLAGLHPDDRVAVVSFDSHLKLWQDFTRDREAARKAIAESTRFTAMPPPRRASETGPLGRHFDFAAAKRAATPERALELAARALAPLAGDKVVVFIGWGLGRFGAGGVRMTPDYRPARRALEAARAAVFVLDISEADYHSLEFGLREVARDTGGTYAKTYPFREQAVEALTASISGHYELTFRRQDLPAGAEGLKIELAPGLKGTVHIQP